MNEKTLTIVFSITNFESIQNLQNKTKSFNYPNFKFL
jgi:hypothetical protein